MAGIAAGRARSISAGEIDAWCSCPLRMEAPGHDRWAAAEREWVEQWGHSPSNLFVFEGPDGEFLGKYDVPVERAGRWTLWAPSARPSPDAADVLAALCRHAVAEATRRGIDRAELILEDSHRHFDLVRASLLDAGFVTAEEKAVVTRDLTALPEKPRTTGGITEIRSAASVGLPELLTVARLAGGDSERLAEWATAVPGEFPGVVAVHDGSLVGAALRSEQPGERLLTLQHFGLIPRARGHGAGTAFLAETLHRASNEGFATYVGSTALGNTAMLRVFERVGCERVGTRLLFGWSAA